MTRHPAVRRAVMLEEAEDVFFGQVVMIWARWILAAAGAVLILWGGGQVADLTARIAAVVVLMAVNFYLPGRFVMEKPANR